MEATSSKEKVHVRYVADQVDGFAECTPAILIEELPNVDRFIVGTGARIVHGGSRACFIPKLNEIHMLERASFTGSATSTASEACSSTVFHELTHWTALPHRCDRDLSGRFGTETYAMEELVAEPGIAVEPRADHAQYLMHWLNVL